MIKIGKRLIYNRNPNITRFVSKTKVKKLNLLGKSPNEEDGRDQKRREEKIGR